jgi:hypothetical protein
MSNKRKIASWLKEAKPEIVEVPVCFNRELLSEFHRTVQEHSALVEARDLRAKKYGDAGGLMEDDHPADECARRLVELHEQVEADKKAHVFRFRKMPYEKFREVIEHNPPTDAVKAASPWLDHDPNTAAPVLVSGSCFDPEMDTDDAEQLREALPESEWAKLYDASIQVNRRGFEIPKSVSSTVALLASELKSTSVLATASPSPSSEGE